MLSTLFVVAWWQVSFVDLAGSERLKDTKSEGVMQKESAMINKSLFVLGKVRTRMVVMMLLVVVNMVVMGIVGIYGGDDDVDSTHTTHCV